MRNLTLGVGTLMLVAIACGGSVTSVDGSKSTGMLTPADQNQLCTDVYNYVVNNFSSGDAVKYECGSEAVDQANCQQAYATCIAQTPALPDAGIVMGALDCTTFDQAVAQCNTTVSEYSKCLQQELSALKSIEGQMPLCGQGALEAAELSALSNNLSSDCIQLLTTCQLTFVPGSSSSSGFDASAD
jgi:hypothetical protein